MTPVLILSLDGEALRLVEDYYERFVRAGANLTEEQKTKIRALNEEQSTLTNKFQQNLMAMKDQIAVYVDTKEELAGLSEAEIHSSG